MDVLGKIKGVLHKKDIDEEIEEVFGKEAPTRSEMVLEGQKRVQERAQVRENPPHRPDLAPAYESPAREPVEAPTRIDQRAELRAQAPQPAPRKEMALPDIPILDDKTKRAIPREGADLNLDSVLLEIRSIKAQNDVIIDTLRRIEEKMQRFI